MVEAAEAAKGGMVVMEGKVDPKAGAARMEVMAVQSVASVEVVVVHRADAAATSRNFHTGPSLHEE